MNNIYYFNVLGDPSVDSPAPPQDSDEKLIFDAYGMATAAVEKIVSVL